MNVAPITTCILVAALGLFIAGEITAGVVICIACAAFEYFLPSLATAPQLPPPERDGVVFHDE